MKYALAFVLIWALSISGTRAQKTIPLSDSLKKSTEIFSVKGKDTLSLDIYQAAFPDTITKKPCIVFVFGGAFMVGRRDAPIYNNYFNQLVENHFVVASVSYRLGLKGVKKLSKFDVAPLKRAIDMAVTDVEDATAWLIAHAAVYGIDTSRIILSGSSAGAITALSVDYFRKNHYPDSSSLATAFRYAGVISFSGAILTLDGALKWAEPPAPTMLFHGTDDRIVPYKKIKFFKKGFYGSSWIAKCLGKNQFPYYFFSEENLSHEVSVLPMIFNIPQILDFIQQFVIAQKPYRVTVDFLNPDAKPRTTLTADELMKKINTQ